MLLCFPKTEQVPAGSLVLALVSLLEVARSFLVRHQAGRSRVGIGSSTLARRLASTSGPSLSISFIIHFTR